MASGGVRIDGLNAVVRSLTKAGVESYELKGAMRKGSDILADGLRTTTPVRSGRLASTIRPGQAKGKATARLGNNSKVVYAPVLNYWKKSKHKGFVERALHGVKGKAIAAVVLELNQIINRNRLK